jgi:hypothetical protein
MARRAARWTIEASDVAPTGDPTWAAAGPDVRRAFWRAVVAYGLKAHDEQTAAGLDRFGAPLRPIRPATRRNRRSEMGPADPNAPPLTPAYAVSRTRLNLTGRAEEDRAVFGWTDGWGRILVYHAQGRGRLPVRDVIGLSPASVRKVRGWAAGWWITWKRTGAAKVAKIPSNTPDRLPKLGIKPERTMTFGVGAGARTDYAESKRLYASGKSTGFYRVRPGRGLPSLGGPGTGFEPPAPPKPPRTPRTGPRPRTPPPPPKTSFWAKILKGLKALFSR